MQPYEEHGYWRDVGNLPAYWSTQMDLLGATPAFDLNNRQWPIMSETIHGLPAKVVGGRVEDSLIGVGSVILNANLRRCILGHGVRIQEGADLQESIIMDHTTIGKGVKLRRVIVDRYNTIESGHTIGYDRERDAQLGYHVDPSGLVALARGVTHWS